MPPAPTETLPDEPTLRELVESYQAPDLDDVIPARHLRHRTLERLDESHADDV